MQETKYGVELDLKIDKFKSKIKEATNDAEKLGKTVKKYNEGRYKGNEIFNLHSMDKEIIQAEAHIKNLKGKWASLPQNITLVRDKMTNVSKEAKIVEQNTNSAGITIDKAFSKGLKSVKRLTIGFLGARSAFMLFRKYLGEYSNQNEEFAQKMQLTTGILVNTLAPAFEFFANVIQYVVIGLARIIELLFGVNILGKTIDNSLKGASKSAKEFNDNLSGLDEISNISESQGGLSTGIGSQLNALNEFQEKIKEVDEWLNRTGIKKFFEELRPILRDVFEWISEHPLGTLGIIGGLKLLGSILPGVMLGTAGAGTGLIGLSATLGDLALIGVVTVGVKFAGDITAEAINDTEEAETQFKDTKEAYDEMIDGWQEKVNTKPTEKAYDAIINIMKAKKSTIESEIRTLKTTLTWYNWAIDPVSYYENKDKIKDLQNDLTELDAQILEAEIKAGRKTDLFNNKFLNITDAVTILKKQTKDAKFSLDELSNSLSGINNIKAKPEVNIMGNAENQLNDIWYKLQKIGGTTIHIDAYGNVFGGGGRSHAMGGLFTGSSWLPITAYAGGGLADEGQMFVAREAGPELVGTIGGHTAVVNNDQIVASVSAGVYDAVVSAMSGQSDRPIVLNIDGREFAKVTYSDYQAESSRRGTNTALRRY